MEAAPRRRLPNYPDPPQFFPERPPPSGRSFVLRDVRSPLRRERRKDRRDIRDVLEPPNGTRGPDRGLHECDRELKRQPDRPDDDRHDDEKGEFGLHVV